MIRVKDLGKAYAPGQFAIRHVSLEFARGDFVAIIGRSGAGKSTLLRCLNLLVRPTEGSIELGGVDVTASGGAKVRKVRGRVGMIFQGFNLVRRLSVLDNVLCGRLRFRTGASGLLTSGLRVFPRDEHDLAFECLKKVQIEHLAFRRADTLSGGQQQRVAIARVLAQEPQVILADEPIASLDPQSARSVMGLLRSIHETRGIPVVVNLHQVEVARDFASRIVGMAGGKVHLDGAPSEFAPSEIESLYRSDRAGADEPSTDANAPSDEPYRALLAGSMTLATGVRP